MRRVAWLPVTLFALLAVVYSLTIDQDPSFDVEAADFASWQLTETGSPVPDLALFPTLDHSVVRSIWIVRTADGREAIGRAPGVIAATVPAYELVDPDSRTDVPGGITAALLTAFAVTLMYLLLRDLVGESRGLAGAVVFGVTTPVWTVAAGAMWPHTLTVLGIAGMAYAAAKDRWWLVGLFGGVALWGRLHIAIAVALVGLSVAVMRRRPSVAIKVGLPSLGMLGLMCLWTRWMYGTFDPTAGYTLTGVGGHALHWSILRDQLGFWVSPYRGVLVWTPLLVLLSPALARSWRSLPDWTKVLPLATLAYTLLEVALDNFTGGDHFYAYRHGLEILTAVIPALAFAVGYMGAWARRLFMPVAVLQFAAMVPGALYHLSMATDTDPWTSNVLVAGFDQAPELVSLTVVAALILGVLVARCWPRFEKPEPAMHVDAT